MFKTLHADHLDLASLLVRLGLDQLNQGRNFSQEVFSRTCIKLFDLSITFGRSWFCLSCLFTFSGSFLSFRVGPIITLGVGPITFLSISFSVRCGWWRSRSFCWPFPFFPPPFPAGLFWCWCWPAWLPPVLPGDCPLRAGQSGFRWPCPEQCQHRSTPSFGNWLWAYVHYEPCYVLSFSTSL